MHIQLSMSLDGKILDTKSIEGVCLGGCVRKLNRMVSAIYDSALADAGLKTSQFSVLVSVANRKQARPAELIKNLQLDESTLSRNVERMCARGWLRLVQDSDRRSHLIEVTDKGQALIRKCIPAWQKAQAEVSRRLGNDSSGGGNIGGGASSGDPGSAVALPGVRYYVRRVPSPGHRP